MIARICLLSALMFLISCGGGGGGGTSTEQEKDFGTITLSGQPQAWSDQISWTLSASVDGLNSNSVSYQMDADGSGLEIDPTTGLILGRATSPAVYDLLISASDASGGSTSKSFTFASNAFVAGHWVMDLPSTNEQVMLVISRNGRASIRQFTPSGAVDSICHGQLVILGDTLSGDLACIDADLSRSSLTIAGTIVPDSSITLADLNDGEDGLFVFQTQAEEFNFGSIPPGIYVEYSDIAQGISLVEVSAEGQFTAMEPEQLMFQNKNSRCVLSGSLEADVIFADYELEQLKTALQVFEATISLSDCDLGGGALDSLDYNQAQAPALGATVLDTLANAPSFNLFFLGATDVGTSDSVSNPGYFRYVQLCDESSEFTEVKTILDDESERFSTLLCPVED
jgi:hypothetical protein